VASLKSHKSRLTFEQFAMAVILVALFGSLVICFVALIPASWSEQLGDHINKMRESIAYFIGLLMSTLGLSWARGAASEQINKPQGAQE